jgi:hypothetical protein
VRNDSHTYPDPDTYSNTDSHTYSDSNTDTDADTDSYRELRLSSHQQLICAVLRQ